jgi:hypothetical protein
VYSLLLILLILYILQGNHKDKPGLFLHECLTRYEQSRIFLERVCLIDDIPDLIVIDPALEADIEVFIVVSPFGDYLVMLFEDYFSRCDEFLLLLVADRGEG